MTEQEMAHVLEICVTPSGNCAKCPFVRELDCCSHLAKETKEYIGKLKAENAALRERLEKAVELPFDRKYEDFHIEPFFGEIKPSLVDDGAKVVIPMYVYFKFNSVEEAKTWLTKQQTGEKE